MSTTTYGCMKKQGKYRLFRLKQMPYLELCQYPTKKGSTLTGKKNQKEAKKHFWRENNIVDIHQKCLIEFLLISNLFT